MSKLFRMVPIETGYSFEMPCAPNITPEIICLCGSTRFMQQFQDANLKETMRGRIVLSVGCNTKDDAGLFGKMVTEAQSDLKIKLDMLHFRKIDLADSVFILNVDGYIGDSTARELLSFVGIVYGI